MTVDTDAPTGPGPGDGPGPGAAVAAAPGSRPPRPNGPEHLWWLARAEWTKLRSVRSTVAALAALVIVCVGLGALVAFGTMARWDRLPAREHAGFDPATRSLVGIFLGQLVIGVLGCLVLSGEYSTGTIRATLAASPQRVRVLAIKSAVFALAAFGVSLLACLIAFWVAQLIYSQHHVQTTLDAPGVPRILVGGALYLTVVGLLGLGLAAILRHTAGAISTLFAIILVLPILANFLPSDWQADVDKYLPSNAGMAVWQLHPEAGSLGPWTGFALFCGYALAALAAGAVLLTRRDA